MDTYEKLQAHLPKHIYAKGKNQGDAPLDGSRRWRATERVISRPGYMAVIMHHTCILRAYEDGSFVLDTQGWHDSPTTREALRVALKFTPLTGHSVYKRKQFGVSQACMTLKDGRVVAFYDGMRFNADGDLTRELVPFQQRRINPKESKEFAQGLKSDGFKAMYPLLYATCKAPEKGMLPLPDVRHMADILTTYYRAPAWSDIIQYYKFEMLYDYKSQTRFFQERGDAKSCWAAMMTTCKASMYETVTSSVSAV